MERGSLRYSANFLGLSDFYGSDSGGNSHFDARHPCPPDGELLLASCDSPETGADAKEKKSRKKKACYKEASGLGWLSLGSGTKLQVTAAFPIKFLNVCMFTKEGGEPEVRAELDLRTLPCRIGGVLSVDGNRVILDPKESSLFGKGNTLNPERGIDEGELAPMFWLEARDEDGGNQAKSIQFFTHVGKLNEQQRLLAFQTVSRLPAHIAVGSEAKKHTVAGRVVLLWTKIATYEPSAADAEPEGELVSDLPAPPHPQREN